MPQKPKQQRPKAQRAQPLQSGPAPKSGRRQAARPRRALTYNNLPEYVKCVLDPFAMPACGYPDEFNQPTLKIKLIETYTLTPDAAGYALFQVTPQLNFSCGTNAVTASVIQGFAGSAHPDYTSVTAQCQWARTVCMGVQVDYIGATMTASGTLTCIVDSKPDYWIGASPNSCVDDGESMPAIQGRKMALVPTQPVRFETDSSSSFMQPTFQNCFILGTGLAGTSPVFRVTVVRHVEGLPLKSAAIARGNATRTPASPAASVALSGIETDSQSTADTWRSRLSSAAGSAWDAVSEAAAPLVYAAGEAAAVSALAAFGL